MSQRHALTEETMFDVYNHGKKVTPYPVSYNYLLTMLQYVDIPWNVVSSLPLGKSLVYDHIIIVREV
jgi:hypothetical protein